MYNIHTVIKQGTNFTMLGTCAYTQIDNGIHQFTFTSISRKTIDQYIDQLSVLMLNAHPTDEIQILLDIRSGGVPPIAYFATRMRILNHHLPYRVRTRMVILYQSNIMLSLLETAINILTKPNHDTVHFVQHNQCEAINWLSSKPILCSS